MLPYCVMHRKSWFKVIKLLRRAELNVSMSFNDVEIIPFLGEYLSE